MTTQGDLAPTAAGVPDIAPVRVPAFRALWVAALLSEMGDWLLHIALPLAVLHLSGSPLITAVTFVLGLAPGALVGPVAGVLVERADLRVVLVLVSLAQGAVLLALLVVRAPGQLWVLYVVTTAQSVLAAVFEPAKNAVLPRLVAPGRLVSANGLLGLTADIGRLAGAPLGGVMLEFTGLFGVVLADAGSFVLVAVLLAGWLPTARGGHDPADGAGEDERGYAAFWAGARGIRASRALRGLLGGFVLMSAAQGMFLLLFVLFVTRLLGDGDATTGLLRGVQAVGGLLGGALVGTVAARIGPRALTGWGLLAVGVVTAVTWNAPWVTTALGCYVGCYVAVGMPAAAAVSGLLAGAQAGAPEHARVRVLAVLLAAGDAAQVVATLAVGALVVAVPLPVLLDAQAGLYLAAGALVLVTVPVGGALDRATRASPE